MRTLWLIIVALLAFAGAIHAQVAAPRLDPTAIEVGATNPAVLSWDGPSRIGGALGVEESEDPSTTASPDAEGDLQALKLRWVGDTFAFGVDAAQVEVDIDPSVPDVGGLTEEFDVSVIGVSFQVGEQFSIGVGQQTSESRAPEFDPTVPALVNFTVKSTLPMVGATLRLAEVFYLGVAAGEETREIDFAVPTFGFSSGVEADATVIRLGVAYRWRDGSNGVHLEAHREEQDPLVFRDSTGVFLAVGDTNETESESDTFIVEVVFSNILIGYEFITTEDTDVDTSGGVTTSTTREEEEETTLSVGWAPEQGLSVVASVSQEEDFDDTGTLTGETTITTVAVAWLF